MTARIALILPSSTYRARDFVAAARAVEAEMVIATEEEQVLSPDHAIVRIDLEAPERSAADIVARGPFDAVIAVDDAGVVIAALAADALGLPHSPPPAVAATRDKAVMRDLLATAGIPQPPYRLAATDDEVAEAAAAIGYPVVLKPLSLGASQGVIRVDHPSALADTASRVRDIAAAAGASPARLLVEGFVPGEEVALEAMLADGELVPLAVLDKPDPLDGPYFEETMFITPSRHDAAVRRQLIEVTAAATRALGLTEGPVHAEARVTPDGVRMLEIAARPIGGLCSRALAFGLLGASLETVLVRHALRLPQGGLEEALPATGVMMIPIPRRGRLEAVTGRDDALAVEGVTGVDITIPTGETLVPLPEGNRYLGFIFARALEPAAVEEALRSAHARLGFDIANI